MCFLGDLNYSSLLSAFFVIDSSDFFDFGHRIHKQKPHSPAFRIIKARSTYQNSNIALTLSRQTSIFGVVFFVFKSLLGIERQKKRVKFTILTRKPRGQVRILMYRTWPIAHIS